MLSCLLLSQWLAMVHVVLHPAGGAGQALQQRADLPAGSAARELHDLATGHESGSAACQLLDQLCHAASGVEAPVLHLHEHLPQRVSVLALFREERAFWSRALARAPPVLA